jgi:hypothetical protein
MTTETTTINLEDVKDAIRTTYAEGVKFGQHWWFVRVWPDGHISSGCEASQTVPESEYYRRGNPHPVTVWSETFNGSVLWDYGILEPERCEPEDAEFYMTSDWSDASHEGPDATFTVPGRFTTTLIDDLDWDMILPDVRRELEEAGYAVED